MPSPLRAERVVPPRGTLEFLVQNYMGGDFAEMSKLQGPAARDRVRGLSRQSGCLIDVLPPGRLPEDELHRLIKIGDSCPRAVWY